MLKTQGKRLREHMEELGKIGAAPEGGSTALHTPRNTTRALNLSDVTWRMPDLRRKLTP